MNLCVTHLHDVGQRGVSGLVEAEVGSDDGGQRDLKGLGAVVCLAVHQPTLSSASARGVNM